MNSVDALVLGFLAAADLMFLLYLRRKRSRALTKERLSRSLVFAVRRENWDIEMAKAS